MSNILEVAVILLPVALRLLGLFLRTPANERKALIGKLSVALKKAEDEKDPSDLSRIINE